MKESNSERREYEVGYGKPPVSTRFKKGERHNSRGRPKRKKALTEIFKKVIDEKVTVAAGDASERITKAQAVLRVNVQEALKGGKSAMANVYELINELGMLDEVPESKRARFFVPRKALSVEEFEREADKMNRTAEEEARQRRERGDDF